jgi:uncharacterized damage-inducible protein DinB
MARRIQTDHSQRTPSNAIPNLGGKPASEQFVALARHSIEIHHLPRIVRCVEMLPDSDIWWRSNAASNSVGNLVLHLCGNVRQWIVSGVGSQPDIRHREQEFAERGPLAKRMLLSRLRTTVKAASRVISSLGDDALSKSYNVQGFKITGFQAVMHVSEHFAFHTGQIVYVAKMKLQKDLGFTRLPGEKPQRSRAKPLPVL